MVVFWIVSKDLGYVMNVVFMGMGEFFYNIDSVIRVVEIMVNDKGLYLSFWKVIILMLGLVL